MASAEFDDIFDILNESILDEDWNVTMEYPTAIHETQSHEHIRGWVDIIGFNQTVEINGIEYYNQSEPIVEYNVWGDGFGFNDNLDWVVVEDDRTYTTGNMTTADIDIHMLWHESSLRCRTVMGHTYCWIHKDYHHENTTFSTTEPTPQAYPKIESPQCYITIYNNSFNSHIEVFVPVDKWQSKVKYQYKNETIIRFNQIGIIETGAANISYTTQWSPPTDNLKFLKDSMIITCTNTSQFNLSHLNVTIYTPYDKKNITEYNVTEITHVPGKEFYPFFWPFIAILLVYGIWIKSNLKGLML